MSESFNARVPADRIDPAASTSSFAGEQESAGLRDKAHDVADKAHDVADHVRERVVDRAQSVRAAASDMDVGELVQQHPWMAVAGAVALGAFLGAGGGAGAAGATAGLAAGAGRGAAGLASRVGEGASGLGHRVANAAPPQVKSAFSAARHDVSDTVGEAIAQLKGTVSEVFHSRIDEFVGELRKGIEDLGGRSSNA